MNAVHDDVVKLVGKELESANKKFPLFRSAHEGCAVILEEFEEAREEIDSVESVFKTLWKLTRASEFGEPVTENLVKQLSQKAVDLACEAIQVAAMAKKFQESMKIWEANNE